MGKILLLISDNPEDGAFALEVANIAGLSLSQVKDAASGADAIASGEAVVVFVEVSSVVKYQAFEAVIRNSVGLFSDKVNSNAIHFLTSAEIGDAPYLIQSPLFGHLVMRNFKNAKEAGQQYGYVVKACLRERAFGLDQLLKPGSKIQVVKIGVSTQKQEAVEAVKAYLLAAKFQSRIATVIANAVDELLMNAMFDAPVDDLRRHTLVSLPRSTSLKLEGKSAVEMQVGFDGQCVAISAIDQFGSLDKAKLLTHLSKMYTSEEYKIKTSVAGAGIGLASVFRSGASLFFMSESQSKTEVIVFFKRTDNFREFKDQFKFISTQFYF